MGIDPFSKKEAVSYSLTPSLKGSQPDLMDDEVQKEYVKAMKTDDLDQILKLQERLGISNKRKFQLSKVHAKMGKNILGQPISASPVQKV
jgi:hypothetical protein